MGASPALQLRARAGQKKRFFLKKSAIFGWQVVIFSWHNVAFWGQAPLAVLVAPLCWV
jgi:hypothetical protein